MKKSNKGVIIFLIIIIIILAIFNGLIISGTLNINTNDTKSKNAQNKITNNSNSQTTSNEYQYSKMKGLYSFVSDNFQDDNNGEYNVSYSLYLYENGTFRYSFYYMASFGYIGNYTIVGNKINLNFLFTTNSGASIDVTNGNHTLTINNENEILDSKQLINSVNLTEIKLKKQSEEKAKEYLKNGDISKYLNDYTIENNASYNKEN